MSRPGSVSLLLAFALGGCGDGLVDGSYAGEPLYTLSGLVRYEGDDLPDAPLYVTILWEPADDDGYSWLPPLRVETTFPARYALTMYAPPPQKADPDALALGAPVLYADEDGDGAILPGTDSLVGGSGDVVLVYLWQDADADAHPDDSGRPGEDPPPDPTPLTAGFHAVTFEHGGCPGDSAPIEVDPLDVDLTLGDAAAAGLAGCDP